MPWDDLQQIFYILVADYVQYILLPLFLAGSLLVAMLMTVAKYWQPAKKVKIDD